MRKKNPTNVNLDMHELNISEIKAQMTVTSGDGRLR